MYRYRIFILPCVIALLFLLSCEKEATVITESAVIRTFKGAIDLENLANYANQTIPAYITKDNTSGNPITDKGATLGRVLFYDKNLSVNNTVSCVVS